MSDSRSRSLRCTLRPTGRVVLGTALLLAASGGVSGAADPWTVGAPAAARGALEPPIGSTGSFEVEWVHDDGSVEADLGLGGATAQPFLWMNGFTATQSVDLEEIWVFFPLDPGISAGAALDLVVFSDDDTDPSNGAELLAVISDTIEIADGATFSIHRFPPVPVPPGDVYLGVIPRFIETGVTPLIRPAAIDTGSAQGRSWLVTWSGNPPGMPTLPSNGVVTNLDAVLPGNFMIRGFARVPSVGTVEVPTASALGHLVLVVCLLVAARARLLGHPSATAPSGRGPR